MVADNSQEWLPPGFTEKVKNKNGRKIRYYYNAATGTKYNSKKEVIRAMSGNGELIGTPQTKNADDNGDYSNENVDTDAMFVGTNDPPQGLPEGWIMEVKTQQIGSKKGAAYKVYTHLSSGRKFYSRAAVTQYLNTLEHATTMTVQNEDIISCEMAENRLLCMPQTTNVDDNGLSSDEKVDAMVVEANNSSKWLPEGWTMEERARQSGPRTGTTYKIYIHSSSGKRFYSRAAVTQYLNTSAACTMAVLNEDSIGCGTTDNLPLSTPITRNGIENVLAMDKNVNCISTKTNVSSQWLPEGWIVEEKTRQSGSRTGSTYKVYIDPSSGKKFFSRTAVIQYLNTVGHASSSTLQNEDHVTDNQLSSPQTTNGDDNVLSTDKNVDEASVKTNDSSPWLPEGWIVEEKAKLSGLRKESSYKLYTELSSGRKFYSMAAVTRYLNTVNRSNSVTEPKNIGNLDKAFPDVSPQCKTSSGHISKKKNQSNYKTGSEITAADDLPPGWIKEIRTTKSGNRIRRDPFYTDPVGGYVFRSKLDALRYVETNDIRSCACRPFKRESDDLKSIKNDIRSGGETCGSKSRAESKAEISKQDVVSNHEEITSSENAAIGSPIADLLRTKHWLSDSGLGKQTDRNRASSTKSKKRRNLELPSQISKRLANSEPSHIELNTSSVNMSADISPTPETKPANAAAKLHKEKPEDQTDGKKSPESQLGYDFGDSWSDPVEFALKTLCGEILVKDNLPFPRSLNEGLNIPSNGAGGSSKPSDGCSKSLQSDEPIIFRNEFLPRAESSTPVKPHGALALLQSNPTLFSDPSNVSFSSHSSFNGQSSTEGGRRGRMKNSNP